MPVLPTPNLSTVAETIQIALAPVFLLTGIGAFLNVLTGRLARVVDRARSLHRVRPETPAERERHRGELRLLDRRMAVINAALLLFVGSAVSICLVVAGLFVAELAQWRLGRWLALAFILAMLLVMAGLVLFMLEVRLSLRITRQRNLATEKEDA